MSPMVTFKYGEKSMYMSRVGSWKEVVKACFSHGVPDQIVLRPWQMVSGSYSSEFGVHKVVNVKIREQAYVVVRFVLSGSLLSKGI